eukprot:evm.model.NODE_30572_length_968_cov_15.372934.1
MMLPQYKTKHGNECGAMREKSVDTIKEEEDLARGVMAFECSKQVPAVSRSADPEGRAHGLTQRLFVRGVE